MHETPDAHTPAADQRRFKHQLDRIYAWFTIGFLAFVLLLGVLEQLGLPRDVVGFVFLLATIALYAAVGLMSRTTDATEYYVAGRRVPAIYNGMAVGADWMSAASFIGMAGTLYLTGYSGLAFVLGWTGGYCLVALLLAPYLRRFGQFTIPDFLGERYGGHLPRFLGVVAAILCSFVYVVAQIYGVGLITSRLIGVAFELGIFLGLGGILVCSFLGGMRAVTWTQVTQYIILIIAYLIPVVWLSVKQTGIPVPQAIYGYQLEKVTAKEKELTDDPKEQEVRRLFAARAEELSAKLVDPAASLAAQRQAAQDHLARLLAAEAPLAEVAEAERNLGMLPRDADSARRQWSEAMHQAQAKAQPLNGMPPHGQHFRGDPEGDPADQALYDVSRRNFLALVFCLVVGTAGLPHILARCYTVPGVRGARHSMVWSILFIFLLYVTAPALAVLVKFEVFHVLVGMPIDQLPSWVKSWQAVDPSLLSVTDINADHILQLNELSIDGDIVVLATPEIAGLPNVVSALVAAGGLAAALSTADGLLLTISSALSHDLYYKMIDPNAATARRVIISKVLLLIVTLLAAYVAAQKPADILFLVAAAFSIAAATFFPALVLGIFWRRTTGIAASLGIMAGLGITMYYMVMNQAWLRGALGITSPVDLWWGIQPISAGIFGVPLGFAVIIGVSLVTRPPDRAVRRLVERVRYPLEAGDARG
ncbi:MAG: VC_2705 family sodium/solute symporter [Hydrogenophaga sp.]|jgi:cation/acetate symporter|uniref:cation acetate symporter n=1 Tax=Hydrogenophaga sp. TaxID=1904254 RepID=UPI00261C1B30|nr:cation acetate symporter [Hydrogenophaga sp.]MDD3784748.1 VC_2705 family sodium/solute symporter [Hydrogenophaga sp.]MDX9969713.1 VC_2705 family sodium/solute symporter [Hydrogenophaga sp.]